jgi:hypothetical protein
MAATAADKAIDIIRERGVVRPRDLAAYGIRRDSLANLQQRGLIQRVGRGLYVAANYQSTEHHTLAEASKRVPHAVVTLLSALRFHGLTTQNPLEVWMAIGINPLGTVYDAYNIGRNSGGYDHHRWAAWNCEGLRVGISINGTLNDPSDMDHCWQMELAIPFAELPSLNGNGPKVGDIWRFLLARYDFSVYLPDGVELSACAMLKSVDFHETEQWSQLRFVD